MKEKAATAVEMVVDSGCWLQTDLGIQRSVWTLMMAPVGE